MCLAVFDPSTRITTNTRNTLAIQPLMSSGHNRPPKLSSPHFLGALLRPTSLRITSVSPHRPVPCGGRRKPFPRANGVAARNQNLIRYFRFGLRARRHYILGCLLSGRSRGVSRIDFAPVVAETARLALTLSFLRPRVARPGYCMRYCTITLASAGLVVPRLSRGRSVQWPFASADPLAALLWRARALWRRRICSLL